MYFWYVDLIRVGGDREAAPNYIVLVTYGNTGDRIAAVEAAIVSRIAGNTLIVAAVADMLKHKLMYQCEWCTSQRKVYWSKPL